MIANCTYAAGRRADLERHYHAMHPAPGSTVSHDCSWPGCHRKGSYGFGRKDKMVEHMREVHKANIPKKKNCGTESRHQSKSADGRYGSEAMNSSDKYRLEWHAVYVVPAHTFRSPE
ncbi:unnamed protein product [Cercospora beticola]|nr:unnamed protein product [Cercospora beticola]